MRRSSKSSFLILLAVSRTMLGIIRLHQCHAFLQNPTVPSFSRHVRRTDLPSFSSALFATSEETRTANDEPSFSTTAQSETSSARHPASSSSHDVTNNRRNGEDQGPVLSELDARVLRDMLQEDSKLDLQQEENMKRLLERGVAPKNAPTVPRGDEGGSEFSSESMKKLTNTKLWKAFQRKGSDVLESARLYIVNRIERDTKLAFSVGLFAWDRAVRDVGRALPASGTSGAAVGRAMRTAVRQLGNSSSFEEMQELKQQQQQSTRRLEDVDNLYEEFNTVGDEIRSVTQSIRDILSGETTSTSSAGPVARGLRSVAPAGLGNNAERQRRAFNRRKKTKLKREKEVVNVGRAAGGVVDAAFEMKRELQVESSKPGYRSEGARKVIAAGAEQTGRLLEAAKRDGWIKALSGSVDAQEETIREMIGAADVESTIAVAADEAIAELLAEEFRVIDRIQMCIDSPTETWLTPEALQEGVSIIDEEGLKEVVTAMICARDDLEVDGERSAENEFLTVDEMVERMKQVKNSVDMIISLAASGVSFTAGQNLRTILYGPEEGGEDGPVLLSLDSVEPSIAAAVEAVCNEKQKIDSPKTEKKKRSIFEILFTDAPTEEPDVDARAWMADGDVVINGDKVQSDWLGPDRAVVAEVMNESSGASSWSDVGKSRSQAQNPQVISTEFDRNSFSVDTSSRRTADNGARRATAELVSDEDFDNAVNSARTTAAVPEGEVESAEATEDNLLSTIALRGLDVALFVVEKVFLAVPTIVQTGTIASQRLVQASRGGLGSFGWQTLVNAASGDKRY